MGHFYVDAKARKMSEKFSLKWNDFKSNVSKSFGIFRNEEYLHDVTLVSDDQHQVTAHKLVLSASSDYFKNIFKTNKHSNPFLCLDGLSSRDLNNILDYIYNGEVQIYQENLDRFLEVAQRFKLEGLLAGATNEVEQEEEIISNYSPQVNTWQPRVPEEPAKLELSEIAVENTSIQLNNPTDIEELDQKLYENMEKVPGGFCCKFCNKVQKLRKDMKFHVETHMEGLSFPCNTCEKEFRSRNARRFHLQKNHKN